jgi:hypothetical protein
MHIGIRVSGFCLSSCINCSQMAACISPVRGLHVTGLAAKGLNNRICGLAFFFDGQYDVVEPRPRSALISYARNAGSSCNSVFSDSE